MEHLPEPGPNDEPEQPISLDELAAAFARAMGDEGTVEVSEPLDETAEAAAEGSLAEAAEENVEAEPPIVEEAAEDPCPVTPATILEAMLFVGNRDGQPLTPQQASDLMRGVAPGEVAGLVDALNQRYQTSGAPYEIVGEGSGYRLALRPEFHGLRDRFYGRVREARLSQTAIDILALVAYRQPISAKQVSQLRGKPSGAVLNQLVRRGLLQLTRPESDPKTPLYSTSERFLALFGLKDLNDLPHSEEIDRL